MIEGIELWMKLKEHTRRQICKAANGPSNCSFCRKSALDNKPRWESCDMLDRCLDMLQVYQGIKTIKKQQYQQYLRSEDWQHIRRIILNRDRRCRICGSNENLEVHHMTYARIFDEAEYDLVTLCCECHEKVHCLDAIGLVKTGYY